MLEWESRRDRRKAAVPEPAHSKVWIIVSNWVTVSRETLCW